MSKSASTRVTKIQTPGEGEAPTTSPEQPAAQQDAAADVVVPSKKMVDRPSRQHYATMRAHEVDPAELKSAVLTLDGWVAPAPAKKA